MSIRLRLTLLYSAILALTLIAFSTVLYVSQTHFTYDSIKTNLARQADAVVNIPRRFPGVFGGAPPDAAPPGGAASGGQPTGASRVFVLPEGALPGRWTQTRNAEGQIVGRSLDLSETSLPLSDKGLKAVQSGSGWFETANVEDQPLLIFSRPYLTQAGTLQIVQVASPIAEREHAMLTLRTVLIAGCSVAILAAFGIGWLLAGAVLNPIHRITDTAQAIGAEHDFSRRVQHTGPNDEVGRLAGTFNGMLAELEFAYRKVKGALDFQRRFVADASHELRTPLTTIRGNIELLRREPPIQENERAEIVSDTTEEVDRMIRLVNQLLVLARADAGQALKCAPLPLQPIVEDVCRQARLIEPGRTVACALTDDAPVLADRDALKQVLLILLDNAIVHTPPAATVEVASTSEDGQVTISVHDSGPGIAPEAMEHIFERFYRGEVSRSGRGTGLGLAIARELVEAQGGSITVESRPGAGSTFAVTLPRATEATD